MAPVIHKNSAAAAGLSKRRAYVTFLAGDGDYVKGAVGLAKGLRKVDSAYPLVAAVLPDVPESHRRLLISHGCIVRDIEPVHPPEENGTDKLAWAYYAINYSKLRIWEFVEYTKMVYLDADIQVYNNIDELFDLADDGFYAALDCCDEKKWSNKPQFEISYCQKQAAELGVPVAEVGESAALYFNAGMFVFEPSVVTGELLLTALKMTPVTPFAEQDFLNMYFRDVYKPIPHVYNLVIALLWRHPENLEVDKVKVVHYCAEGSKPWRYTGKEENMDREDIKMLVKKWWDIYNDDSLNYESPTLTVPIGGSQEAELRMALSETGVVHYIAPSAA